MGHIEYDSRQLNLFFLRHTKNEDLTPINFQDGVKTDGDLFDMIEIAILFLNEELRKSNHRYP